MTVDLTIVNEASGPTVRVRGALDYVDASAFAKVIEAAIGVDDAQRVVVDLSGCMYLSEHGLSLLLAARSFCERKHVDLVLVPGPAPVQRKFSTTGTARIFRFAEP